MTESVTHAEIVSEWFERTAKACPTRDLAPLFGRALLAVWERARVTLGEVTLRAVFDRVLGAARQRFPCIARLRLGADPDIFRSLVEQREVVTDRAEFESTMRWVMTELLTLLGGLTGEILSSPLHAALRAVQSMQPVASSQSLSKGEEPS